MDSVRLATGELDSSEEGVIREVTRVYTERSKPVVPKETAGMYPWEHPQREKPLILLRRNTRQPREQIHGTHIPGLPK